MAILEASTSIGDITTIAAAAAKTVSITTDFQTWNGDTTPSVPTTITFVGSGQNLAGDMLLRVRGFIEGDVVGSLIPITIVDGTTRTETSASLTGAVTSVPVDSTAAFPDTGTITFDGTGDTFIYTSKTLTTFDGVSQTLQLNAENTVVSSEIGITVTSTSANISGSVLTADLETGNYVRIEANVDTGAADGSIEDTITAIRLSSVADGESAYQVLLTNEAHTVPASNDRSAQNFLGSGTTIRAFYGTTELEFVTTTATLEGQFTIGTVAFTGGITGGTITDNGTTASLEEVTDWTGSVDVGSRTLPVTMRGAATAGSTSFDKIQSLTRSITGAVGATGPTGKTLRAFTDRQAFTFDGDSVLSPSSQSATISFVGQSLNSTSVTTISATDDAGVAFGTDVVVTGGANGSRALSSAQFDDNNFITFTITNVNTGDANLVDTIRVYRLSDGGTLRSLMLTSNDQTFTFDENGTADPSSQSIVFTADLMNITGTVAYSATNQAGTAITIPSTGITVSGNTLTMTQAGFDIDRGSPTVETTSISVTATLTVTIDGTATAFSDTVTVHRLTAGSTGASAKSLRLSTNGQVFTFNTNNAAFPVSQVITFTAATQNVTGTDVSFSVDNGITLTSETDTTTSITVTNFGTNTSATVTATIDGVSDTYTVYRLDDGGSVYTVLQTNETHSLPSTENGSVTIFDGSSTNISAYYGTTELTFSSGSGVPGDGQFRIELEAESGTSTTGIAPDGFLTSATVPLLDAFTSTIGSRTFKITASGPNGIADEDIEIVQSFSKSQVGDSAYTVFQTNEAHSLPSLESGQVTVFSGSGTSLSAFYGDTALTYNVALNAANTFRIDSVTATGGITPTSATVLASATVGNITAFNTASAIGSRTFNITTRGPAGTTNGSFSVIQSFSKSQIGDSTYNVFQTNEAHTLPANADGTTTSLAGSGTTIQAFYGTTAVTTLRATAGTLVDNTFRITAGDQDGVIVTEDTGGTDIVSGHIFLSSTIQDISSFLSTSDLGVRNFNVEVKGPAGTTAETFALVQSFSKSKAGTDPFTGFLTNETETIPTDANGLPTPNPFSVGGTFRVFEGTVDITDTDPDTITYSVGTRVGIAAAAVTIDASSGVYEVTALTDTTSSAGGSVIFEARTGTTLRVSKQFTITKSLAGTDGTAGAEPNIVRLEADRQTFTFDNSNSATTSSDGNATMTATVTGFDDNTVAPTWTAVDSDGTDISAVTAIFEVTSTTAPFTAVVKAAAFGANSTGIITVAVTATRSEGTPSVSNSDTITVYKVREGDTVAVATIAGGISVTSSSGASQNVMDGADGAAGGAGAQGERGPGRFFLEVSLPDATAPEVGPSPYETDTDFRDNAQSAIDSALGNGITPIKDDVVTVQYNLNAAPNTDLTVAIAANSSVSTITVTANGTTGFPDAGTLLIGTGATQESFTYSSRGTNTFSGNDKTFFNVHNTSPDSESVVALNGTTVVRSAVHDGLSTAAVTSWDKFALEIDGSLLVQGTVVSNSIATGAVNASKVSVDGSIRIRDPLGSISGGLTDVSWNTSNSSNEALSDDTTLTNPNGIGSGFWMGNVADGTSRFFLGNADQHIKVTNSGVVFNGITASFVGAASTSDLATTNGNVTSVQTTANAALAPGEAAADVNANANITTINGGSITTNTITANEIATGTITANSGVIADLAVETLKLAGNAVTIPLVAFSTPFSEDGATTKTLAQISIPTVPGLGSLSIDYLVNATINMQGTGSSTQPAQVLDSVSMETVIGGVSTTPFDTGNSEGRGGGTIVSGAAVRICGFVVAVAARITVPANVTASITVLGGVGGNTGSSDKMHLRSGVITVLGVKR